MDGQNVLEIIEDNPDWLEYGLDAIRDIETQGNLVLWMAQKHDYMSELCAEVIPRADEGEYILEIFNPDRDEKLYRNLRDWFWRYVSEALDEEMEKVWQRNDEAIRYE